MLLHERAREEGHLFAGTSHASRLSRIIQGGEVIVRPIWKATLFVHASVTRHVSLGYTRQTRVSAPLHAFCVHNSSTTRDWGRDEPRNANTRTRWLPLCVLSLTAYTTHRVRSSLGDSQESGTDTAVKGRLAVPHQSASIDSHARYWQQLGLGTLWVQFSPVQDRQCITGGASDVQAAVRHPERPRTSRRHGRDRHTRCAHYGSLGHVGMTGVPIWRHNAVPRPFSRAPLQARSTHPLTISKFSTRSVVHTLRVAILPYSLTLSLPSHGSARGPS
ncbi:hypothetical protein OH77DRAFT_203929 [Trametes cingulata]|nr:hypothetical protein OH77DRAFT_203929 [Trametes cingulata]